MKKRLLALAFLPCSLMAQMVFTGGPLNLSGNCPALWASGDSAFMGFNESLFRTTDGGVNWELLTNGIPADADPRTIEYSNNTLIIGTNDGGRVYKSTDFGDSFASHTAGITSIAIPTASTSGPGLSMMGGTTFGPHIFDFTADSWVSTGNGGITHGMAYLGGDTVWLCSGGIATGTTVYSHDNGATWTQVALEPQTDVGGGVILSTAPQDFVKTGSRIIVATNFNNFPLLYTDDYGASWQSSDLTGLAYSDYGKRFIRINDNHILTSTSSGIYKSTDQGTTWTQIQSLGQIRTMVRWKNDHILIGTNQGVCEFDNYGEGTLVKKHGAASSVSNLVLNQNQTIVAGNSNGLYQFSNAGVWSELATMTSAGQPFSADRLAVVGDSLYVFNSTGYYASGDGGVTIEQRSSQAFGGQLLTMLGEMDGKQFAGTKHFGGGAPQEPEIYYSSDNGASYTQASFTNAVSYNFGATGGNYVERFFESGNALLADMNAGIAISADGGLTWTFKGDAFSLSVLSSQGNDIYHYNYNFILGQKSIEVSSDNGQNWTDVPLDGLPNSTTGFQGVWNLNGDICTYNAHEAPRGIYKYDAGSSSWSLIPGTAASLEDWDGITDMHYLNDNYYANWELNGTWTTGEVNAVEEAQISEAVTVFPNPFTNQITVKRAGSGIGQVIILDQSGRVVRSLSLRGNQEAIDMSGLPSGLYLLRLEEEGATSFAKLLKQ